MKQSGSGSPQRVRFSGLLPACLVVLIASFLWAQTPGASRVWTARSGATLEATFVRLTGEVVVLQKPDGSQVRINRSALSAADLQFLNQSLAPAPVAPPAGPPGGGSLNFKVTTVSDGGPFAPRHIFAAWVEKADGTFVRTLERRARNYIRYLVKWNAASGDNDTDAVTGASLTRHKSHNLTWDLLDADGRPVPDGDYVIRVEFSERNGPGPSLPRNHVRFTKGPQAVSLEPADQDHFKDMSLTYQP